jgi:hypothetical protein
MTSEYPTGEFAAVDESSWVYLSALSVAESPGPGGLRERIVEACEASGWLTVSCQREGESADPGRFFEGVRHAVEHADVVVTLVGTRTEMSDAELAMAYSHGRPIVALQISDEQPMDSEIQTMLQEYGRAQVLTCESIEECADGLRAVFADPDFVNTIRLAR